MNKNTFKNMIDKDGLNLVKSDNRGWFKNGWAYHTWCHWCKYGDKYYEKFGDMMSFSILQYSDYFLVKLEYENPYEEVSVKCNTEDEVYDILYRGMYLQEDREILKNISVNK